MYNRTTNHRTFAASDKRAQYSTHTCPDHQTHSCPNISSNWLANAHTNGESNTPADAKTRGLHTLTLGQMVTMQCFM